ncbi:MAG: fasciclin domain-containing protein [Acidimicrobiia bacterium]
MFRRPAAGEVGVSAADGPAAPMGQTTNAVVHVATIPLSPDVGDFASGAVEDLGPFDALIVLFEYDPEAADKPLFAVEGMPRSLTPTDFSPATLQRSLRGQAGVQRFFREAGRAFCLYVVLGSMQNRARVVPEVNQVLGTFTIGDVTASSAGETVVDIVRARPDLGTFAALLDESGVASLLASARAVTVFAPVNAAFDDAAVAALRADPDFLKRTVLHHVADGRIAVEELIALGTVETEADGVVPVTGTSASLVVGGAEVTLPPADATNGLVYVTGKAFEAPR